MKRTAIPLAVLPLVLLAGCQSTAAKSSAPKASKSGPLTLSQDETNPPAADISVATCAPDDVGVYHVTGTVTNHSSKPSDYIITFELDDPSGTRLGTADDFEQALAAGQSAAMDAISTVSTTGVKVTCKLLTVDRTASAG
jgi:hypothetical protein